MQLGLEVRQSRSAQTLFQGVHELVLLAWNGILCAHSASDVRNVWDDVAPQDDGAYVSFRFDHRRAMDSTLALFLKYLIPNLFLLIRPSPAEQDETCSRRLALTTGGGSVLESHGAIPKRTSVSIWLVLPCKLRATECYTRSQVAWRRYRMPTSGLTAIWYHRRPQSPLPWDNFSELRSQREVLQHGYRARNLFTRPS